MLDSNILNCLFALAILALFAGIIVWMVRRERARKEANQQALASLGFARVANPGADLLTRLERVHRRSPQQKFSLAAVYEKTAPDGKFLIFELNETSGEGTTYLGSNAVAVLSPGLDLPRVLILGRIAAEGQTAGWMAGAAEKVIAWAMIQSSLQRLSYEDAPDVESKLMVAAEDAAAARAWFTPDRLRRLTWLAEIDRLSSIECAGDLFILKRQTTQARSNPEQDLPNLLRDAQHAWMALAYREVSYSR